MAYFRRYLTALLMGYALKFAPQAEAQPAASTATIEFTVFAQQPLPDVFFLPDPNGQPVRLNFYSQSKSRVYSYTGPAGLRFFRPVAGAKSVTPQSAPPPVTPLASFAIPQGASKLTLFFFANPSPDATNPLPYAIFGADESLARLPRGHLNVLNASGRIYSADFGNGRPVTLGPGLSAPIAVNSKIQLRLATQLGEKWALAGNREFVLGANNRGTLVFFPPLEAGGIAPNIRQLFEELPPEEKKKSP